MVRDSNNDYVALSGNQVGVLLTYYILSQKLKKGTLPQNASVISTIVSTKMTEEICKSFNVRLFKTFTGFKFIGEKILEFEKNGEYQYVFGFEESYGFLAGTHARDKDAVAASMLIAEMAAYYDKKCKTLLDIMTDLYNEYGAFAEDTISITKEGITGIEQIQQMMHRLREEMPKKFGDFDITAVRDYKTGMRYTSSKEILNKLDISKSNVLYFELSNGIDFAVRPSGTEPKIKFYFLAQAKTREYAIQLIRKLQNSVWQHLGL
jgi:phosphoglucomutase